MCPRIIYIFSGEPVGNHSLCPLSVVTSLDCITTTNSALSQNCCLAEGVN